jgi:hypothetical protein
MTNVDDPGTYNPDLFHLRVPQVCCYHIW